MVGHHADRRINGFLDDFFRTFRRDFLDVHPALGARHHYRPRRGAVEQHREVKLLFDVRRDGHQQLADQPPFRSGLFCHQHIAQHRFGFGVNVLARAAQLDAALKAILESALATSARVNLGLYHDERRASGKKPLGDILRCLWCVANLARRHRHAKLRQQLSGLVLVDVHAAKGLPDSGTKKGPLDYMTTGLFGFLIHALS